MAITAILNSGSQYWAYDDEAGQVELDYPRNISWWSGVPHHIDAVFQFTDKKTYFFKVYLLLYGLLQKDSI